jgi:hypothetical protein
MKTYFKVLMMLIVALTFASCNKDDEAIPATTESATFFKTSIDGVTYKSEGASVVATNAVLAPIEFKITSTTPQGIFEFVLNNHVGVGNYTVNGIGGYTLIMRHITANSSDPFATNTCGEDEGTLTITKLSKIGVEGTFSFIGKQRFSCAPTAGKVITNGVFKANLVLKQE